jgi:Spy/CpxP family protein refolding chaperone
MKTWKRIALVLAIALGVGGATAAVAANAHRRGAWKQMIDNRVESALNQINATPDQRATVEQAKTQILQALQQSRQQLRQERPNFAQLFTADQLDTKALYDFANQRAQQVNALAQVIVPQLQKVHDALTPAQRQQLAQMWAQHHQNAPQGGFGGQ